MKQISPGDLRAATFVLTAGIVSTQEPAAIWPCVIAFLAWHLTSLFDLNKDKTP